MKKNSISILYVEDENSVREMLGHFIGRFCESIYTAADGAEGLALYEQHRVDIVISDIKMPKLNGIEMVEKIKAMNPEQIVIFTTAHIDSDYLFRAIELQVGAYVPKPVDLDMLKDNIDKAIRELESRTALKRLQESEEKFRRVANMAHMGIMIYKEYFLYVNDALCEMTGYSREELLAMHPWEIAPKEQQKYFKDIAMRRLKGEHFQARYNDLTIPTKNGELKTIRVNADTMKYEDGYAGFSTMVDVTDIVHTSKRLKQLAQAMEQMDEMVRISDTNGTISFVNEALTKHTGYKKSELIGVNNNIFQSGKHSKQFYANFWEKILSKNPHQITFVNKKKNGELYYEELTVTPILDEEGEIEYFVSTGKDITQRLELEKKLQELATVDTLTGVWNRYKTNEYIDDALIKNRRHKRKLGLIMFDIDHFKHVNDTYGHDVGDIVLKEFAALIKKSIRESDKFGRWGGEEFMLLSEETKEENIVLFSEKLCRIVEAP